MKALHVRRLYLWPRFQAQARQDLEARPPQVGCAAGSGRRPWICHGSYGRSRTGGQVWRLDGCNDVGSASKHI